MVMRRAWVGGAVVVAVAVVCGEAGAQQIEPFYRKSGCYRLVNLGAPPGVPGPLGGVVFDPLDRDVLLIGASANQAEGRIMRVRVAREGGGVIAGFVGNEGVRSTSPNIDGGLAVGPGNVLLYTGYPINVLGQIKPGSVAPDRVEPLTPLGVAPSVGAMQVVPAGFPGAGRLKLGSYTASLWYDATLTPDGAGTFNVALNAGVSILIGGGPEGIVYVARGNPAFANDSVLVSEYQLGNVVSYEIDGNGDPVVSTRRVFVSGLTSVEGGTRDPVTGDFLFSTFNTGNRLYLVTGFTVDCRANLSGDCVVDFNDLLEFLNLYNAQDPRADFTGDGAIDFNDLLEFLNEFNRCV